MFICVDFPLTSSNDTFVSESKCFNRKVIAYRLNNDLEIVYCWGSLFGHVKDQRGDGPHAQKCLAQKK